MDKPEKDARGRLDAALTEMFARAHAQFGSAVKSHWLYPDDSCPGCGLPVDIMRYKGKKAVSFNSFIYRQRGVLIGYLLCGRCAERIFKSAEKNPNVQIPLHEAIEQNLIKAYHRYLISLDA